jgi:hypothetical protein
MKKTIGIVLLILAALVAVNVTLKLSHASSAPLTDSRAYNAGHTAGMVTAPILLGLAGLWLLLGGGNFPVKRVLAGLGIMAGLFVLALAAIYLVYGSRRSNRMPAPFTPTVTSSAPAPGDNPPASAATPSAAYTVGQKVSAKWAGQWIAGKITEVNSGGFSAMVQLEDARWPQPIVLSTNLLRPE